MKYEAHWAYFSTLGGGNLFIFGKSIEFSTKQLNDFTF
jgi:hypothetical protein